MFVSRHSIQHTQTPSEQYYREKPYFHNSKNNAKMNMKSFLAASALTVAHFALPSLACDPRNAQGTDGEMPPLTLGPDEPADPATLGYFINHFSLNVQNLTASINFYTSVFGIRHIFTMEASEHLSIAYLGHSQGGRNGTGYQTTDEINREKNNNAGLIELIFLDVDREIPPSSEKSNTFGHIGVVVPDVEAAQARLEGLPEIEFLKKVGEPTPTEGKIADSQGFYPEAWAQLAEEEQKAIEKIVSAVNLRFIYITDPDGNIVEIQPQD